MKENVILDAINFDSAVKIFNESGFLVLRGVLDKQDVIKLRGIVESEFVLADQSRNELSPSALEELNCSELPVLDEYSSPRTSLVGYRLFKNPAIEKLYSKIFNDDFLWHFPPMFRRMNPDINLGHLPYHQDYFYNQRYEHILISFTTLSPCGVDAPGLTLVRHRYSDRLPHSPTGAHFPLALDKESELNSIKNYDEVSLELDVGDVVVFDELTLHKTDINNDMHKIRYSMDVRCAPLKAISKQDLKERKYINPKTLDFIK